MSVLSGGHMVADMCQGSIPALLPFLIHDRGYSYAAASALVLAATVSSSVVGVALALDEALLLELVEQANERAAVVAERVGDRRLGLGHALVEQGKDRVMVRAQPCLLVLVERVLLRVEAQPLEQDEARCSELRG